LVEKQSRVTLQKSVGQLQTTSQIIVLNTWCLYIRTAKGETKICGRILASILQISSVHILFAYAILICVVPRYCSFATFSKDLLAIVMSLFDPARSSRRTRQYEVTAEFFLSTLVFIAKHVWLKISCTISKQSYSGTTAADPLTLTPKPAPL
jgi:hypothetical protein